MRFGLFSVHDVPTWTTDTAVHRNTVEQFVASEELGFDSIWVAEHHIGRYATAGALSVILSAVAARTNRIRLGSAVSVLPLSHPIRIAEEYATLDILSGGRLDFGIGRGYTPIEFSAFNENIDENRERMEESIEIILRAWTEESFSYDGKHYEIPEVQILPQPIQEPHPPVLIASSGNQPGVSPLTFNWAVRKGWGVMFSTGRPNSEVREHRDQMRIIMKDAGFSQEHIEQTMARSPVQKQIYVAPTDEEAILDNERGVTWFYQQLANRRMFGINVPAPYDGKPYNWYLDNKVVFFGSPERVADQIAEWRDTVGGDYIMCWMNCGALPHEKIMRSMRLFADKVMPRFK